MVLLILLIFVVRGCREAQQKRSFKDYAGEVNALVQESNQQSEGLFTLLREPGDQGAVELQNTVNGFRVQAEQLVERAQKEGPPDDFSRAHRYLIDVLEFRRDGLAAIARELPTALGDSGRREAAARIAGDMQNFLSSDVVYSQRVLPGLEGPLREKQVRDEVDVSRSTFLPDIDWLRDSVVGERISGIRGGDEAATPGLHGTALGTVTAGGVALTPGAAATVPSAEDLTFSIQVQNGGESAERDVVVRVTVSGDRPIEAEETIDEIAAGATETVTIPLAEPPPTGRQVEVSVTVEAVPGEEQTDNNEATYQVTFE